MNTKRRWVVAGLVILALAAVAAIGLILNNSVNRVREAMEASREEETAAESVSAAEEEAAAESVSAEEEEAAAESVSAAEEENAAESVPAVEEENAAESVSAVEEENSAEQKENGLDAGEKELRALAPDGAEIIVRRLRGTFPAGARVRVFLVPGTGTQGIVKGMRDDVTDAADLTAYDITIFDRDGREILPDEDVVFSVESPSARFSFSNR